MMRLSGVVLLMAVVACACASALASPFQPRIADVKNLAVYSTWQRPGVGNATLYAAHAPGYDEPIYVLNITGVDHHAIGYGYGILMANQSIENFENLINALLPEKDLQLVLEAYCDWQYEYIIHNLPQDFQDEIKGIEEGTADIGLPHAAKCIKRALTIASIAVGDLSRDILYLLKNELSRHPSSSLAAAAARLQQRGLDIDAIAEAIATSKVLSLGRTCSMFGAWGTRTENGRLFSGRNLDWAADTGIAKNKLVTVYHIGENTVPYASVSFSGVIGAITGISAAGITVHEAGDDTRNVTLNGFAWSLRLRALMEEAKNMDDALSFWKRTRNTMGMNHGVGSAADNKFLAMETEEDYTAYFFDNDPREANFVVDGKHYGFPLKDAVWRTNHGYDPTFRADGFSSHPGTDSFNRYLLLHDTFLGYETASVAISDVQAVNLTAVVGDKGGSSRDSFLSCQNAAQGSNIISATFKPSTTGHATMYLAFENGHKDQHVPACCNNYIKFDMNQFFGV
ncbi:hypothetical protein PTSG_00872 [Salpingoeca rosetta]|uniref:Peptidase C45 hydrolase domain-containing protein n=1 Tax=Salpingoeca rosetta (strain ATCC 50818 / BSB-021) TaxID=946362 RepID=F2TXQ6_SALR5|nr:uncharacterized protein PTSG_00872 [Salpingoeca rosetta]EGD76165.1 hypothetical protein PTSG_00872 [Salpingoeca rosetta]|eukprot:XP_004998340.1 hypothetical protein PTSG_00872 [Salpingoeca rosetta]